MKKAISVILLGTMLTAAFSMLQPAHDEAFIDRHPPIIIQNGVTTAS